MGQTEETMLAHSFNEMSLGQVINIYKSLMTCAPADLCI